MVYEINGIPVCGIQLGFFASSGNITYKNFMLSHGPVLANSSDDSPACWLRLPFPIKVYALSLTTDFDGQSLFNIDFTVRKILATDNTNRYTHDPANNPRNKAHIGTVAGSTVYFNDIEERHHQVRIFSNEPTLAANDSIGLMANSSAGGGERILCKIVVLSNLVKPVTQQYNNKYICNKNIYVFILS